MNTHSSYSTRKHNDEWTVRRHEDTFISGLKVAVVELLVFAAAMATVYVIFTYLF